MDDSDSASDDTWVFYRDREEWANIDPIPQEDGPNSVVAIAYSAKFSDVYDYFRAIFKANEKSERALQLTKDALELNPANYTVWQYRRKILKHIKYDSRKEFKYSQEMIENNPKNYQVWHHRRVIVEWLNDPSEELNLTAKILSHDAKNYHAWQHRQWVIGTYNTFQEELKYVESLLDKDVRNNSAWNQRYYVINSTTGFTKEIIDKEVNFTLDKINKATNNESAWNYLKGVLFHYEDKLCENNVVTEICENLFKSGNRSIYLMAFLIDICEENIEKGNDHEIYNLGRALKLCNELANNYDNIRQEYWNYIARSIALKVDS